MKALPALLFSDEVLIQLVGFNAQQLRDRVCQRGAAKRQDGREAGPIAPDTLARRIVRLNLRELEGKFNGVIRTLAQAGVLGNRVTGITFVHSHHLSRRTTLVFCIGGTHVRLETIVNAFKNGSTAEEILLKFPSLSLTDIYAVITYCLWCREEVEAYLEQRRRLEEAIHRGNEARFAPAGVRERLLDRPAPRV